MPADLKHPTTPLLRAREREQQRRERHNQGQLATAMEALHVSVDDLDEGGIDVKETLTAELMSEILDDGRDIRWRGRDAASIDLHIDREAGFVHTRGKGSFKLVHPCVRCLNDVPFDVDLSIDLRLVKAEKSELSSEHVESDDEVMAESELEDLGVASYHGNTIELSEIIREQLFLDLPMHPACNSPRAKPTAPCSFDPDGALKQEQSRWVDDRWAALLPLKEKLEKNPPPRTTTVKATNNVVTAQKSAITSLYAESANTPMSHVKKAAALTLTSKSAPSVSPRTKPIAAKATKNASKNTVAKKKPVKKIAKKAAKKVAKKATTKVAKKSAKSKPAKKAAKRAAPKVGKLKPGKKKKKK